MSIDKHTPLVLIILDGWGHLEQLKYNAIKSAQTPVWDQLWKNYPHTFAEASGRSVGLPEGQMGNSEVGHLHMGAGRSVPQDLTRIDIAIETGEFFTNAAFSKTFENLKASGKALHILGLLSPGGVHSHENHIQALIKMAADYGLKKIYLHAFLDGRDTPPKSALPSIEKLAKLMSSLKVGCIASLCGRYYAMDRDKRWERTQKAYDMLTMGQASYYVSSATEGLEAAYARQETDEFVQPTLIQAADETTHIIQDGDAVIFMNFRADRARQLSHALTDQNFEYFQRQRQPKLSAFITLTEYAKNISAQLAFPPITLSNIFGEYISKLGLSQLRIAETEKYAHVTFFFDGGEEKNYPGMQRILIPSPKVATYDLKPEMSAYEITDELVKAISSRQFDVIICNFANPDMVGHTGNLEATIQAIEVIDNCLNRIVETLHEVGGEALITSDHGNAECMYDPNTQQPHTAHTTNKVPVIYVGRNAIPTTDDGILYDIAPTLLYLLGLPQPQEMTGHSLFKIVQDEDA